jgi:hypothetical protein
MSSAANRLLVEDETVRLFHRLNGKFNDNTLREIVLASAGIKVSRTCLNDSELHQFLEAAREGNLEAVVSEEKYIHRRDIGKGGWSNSLASVVPTDHPEGLFNVYIACAEKLAKAGLSLEATSDEDGFGSLLGIPHCCIEAYVRFHPVARLKQNDFVPLVLESTSGPAPYSPWNNYVSQYFGRALLSFFPCSFNCPEAESFARASFEVLQQCSAPWADGFLRLQRTNILYTEYLGLHMFAEADFRDGWIEYDAGCVQSTETSEVSKQINLGNRLRVLGKHEVEIYEGGESVCRIGGEDVSMCIFN